MLMRTTDLGSWSGFGWLAKLFQNQALRLLDWDVYPLNSETGLTGSAGVRPIYSGRE